MEQLEKDVIVSLLHESSTTQTKTEQLITICLIEIRVSFFQLPTFSSWDPNLKMSVPQGAKLMNA